jgi:Astacin (Peptidase family M12A)
MRISLPPWPGTCTAIFLVMLAVPVFADSDPAHLQTTAERPLPWPAGVIPYDISKLTPPQQAIALRAMQRWMDTGAKILFIRRTAEAEFINFTGNTNAGNNTSNVGFKSGVRTDINITAFWWRQQEWMPVHELGHVLGFFHEHERWDRDQFVTIHYDNIKAGRAEDYDWIARTNWLVSSLPYDYRSIMHYRICWASRCEDQCKDGVGNSPCAVIKPVDKQFDAVIGQWTENGVSPLDAERARLVYGTTSPPAQTLRK